MTTLKKGTSAALREKAGQLLMIGFRGMDAEAGSAIHRDVRSGRVGGVVLFDRDLALRTAERNIRSPEQVRRLCAALQSAAAAPLLVAVDQEGGEVARLKEAYGFPPTLSARQLGRIDDVKLTRAYAESSAAAMAACGINLNFAPLVDLDVNPGNPIIGRYGRSYGANPAKVVRHALAVIAGCRRHGVLCTLKHFPGHGSSRRDSHLGFTDVSDTWERVELRPFRRIIARNHADVIMTAHIFNRRLDPDFPATLSRKTLTGLLREKMEFAGVLMSDDMDMKAISDEYDRRTALELALNAGNDILLFANNLDYREDLAAQTLDVVLELISAGRVAPTLIERAWRRVMRLKKKLSQAAGA
jgi:beta-N-acetylhexosaminidase